jgi:hypothetical protein
VARSYASFLIRLWRLGPDQMRIKLEHIQTGEVAQLNTLAEAVVWLEGCATNVNEMKQAEEEVIRPAE